MKELHPSGHVPSRCTLKFQSMPNATLIVVQAIEMPSGPALEDFESQVTEFVKRNAPKRLVLDFALVRFMSSETLRSLIRIRDQVVGRNGKLHLCNLQPNLREVFKLTNLDRLFPMFDSGDKALEGFK